MKAVAVSPFPRSLVASAIIWIFLFLLIVALCVLPLPVAVVLVGGSIIAILAFEDPTWALYAAVLSVPVQEMVHLPGGITVTQATLVLLAATWGLHILAHPERRVLFGSLFPALLLFVWFLLFATAFTPYSQIEGLKESYRWATVVLVYLVTLNSVLQPQKTATNETVYRFSSIRLIGLVICLLVATGADAAIGLWQFQTGTGPESFRIGGGNHVRAYGTIGKPNSFAVYMNMGWSLAVALAIGSAWHWWEQHGKALVQIRRPSHTQQFWQGIAIAGFFGAMAILLLAGLLTSFSRGGWVGAAGGGGAMLMVWVMFLSKDQRRLAWLGVGGLAVAAILLAFLAQAGLLPSVVMQRVGSITRNIRLFDVRTVYVTPENFAVVERMAQIQAAYHMFQDAPLHGVGPGNYTLAYEGHAAFSAQPYAIHPWYTSRGHAHNYYVHIAAEAGIGGLLSYCTMLLVLGLAAYRAIQHTRHWFLRSIIVGCCGIIVSITMHNLFEHGHVLNMGVQLGAVWAILIAAAYTNRDKVKIKKG